MNIFLENSEVEKILSDKTAIKFLKDLDQNNDLNQSSLNLVFDNINEALELKKYLNDKYQLKSVTINSN